MLGENYFDNFMRVFLVAEHKLKELPRVKPASILTEQTWLYRRHVIALFIFIYNNSHTDIKSLRAICPQQGSPFN